MPFLSNYTNPATNSLAAYYKSTQEVDDRLSDHEYTLDTPGDQSYDGTTDNVNSFIFGNPDEQWWDDIIFARPSLHKDDTLDHSHVQARMAQVALDLTTIQRTRCRKRGAPPLFDAEAFKTLFTHKNVIEFTEVYFTRWSPHCPILHCQTFDLTKVHPPLLLAVFLIGEAYSHDVHPSLAQAYYDIAEEYTFNHPKFRELLEAESPSSSTSARSLEPLQAAYLMVLLQMSGKNVTSRRRVRNARYDEVIQAARGLKLFDSKNEYLDREQSDHIDFAWHGFVIKESRIRLAYLIFGIECNFAMFHAHYPRLAVSEMTGSPMCSERCFSAATSAACEQYAKQEMRSNMDAISTSLSQLLDSREDLAGPLSQVHLSPMNFFFVLCGLHCAIHASRANGTGKIMYPAFMRALGRWMRIWELQVSNLPAEEWKKLGFMRDAGPEFCQLAYFFLEADARGMFDTEKLRSMDSENMGYVNYLLEAFSRST
ncbi:hypothetical protein LTR10_016340 [Elasticomyces elasticus]|uniref:Xylanolytic transcriptional activator regulatory domain-containing protein n=1 Tax=Exophiala sideris TaxID=1016849 RepID=A0ABR0J669_9EURO|nr:hypothetical protein LTR10_016340 [Elasticomyces elasticus]KAK5028350.1 hypothetical protein LTS07_006441 [Exophiala sideris]KAK5036007.1 hypothetical protein LTR13_005577 [Exophiala sideris]KAK5057043.1 hypothetical protein LTR69_007681 [Exophiala sideris]KAK5181450.1 hypothetical protein LTR44_006245 [Eurotiomycetes sp. CCFEE 6388]